MKKMLWVLVLALLMMVPAGCRTVAEESDAARFKKEYELLNGQSNLDGSALYQVLNIPEDNPFVYADPDDLRSLFDNGSGVVYLGFADCPWCRTLLPALLDAAETAGYTESIYYYNALYERDTRVLDETGEIVVEQEGSDTYLWLVETLSDHLGPYEGLNDDSIKRIYFPTTVFVRAGEVQSAHLVTVDSQEDAYAPLTEGQYSELVDLLTQQFETVTAQGK